MYCKLCGGEGEFLGQLGNSEWYRCRNCGIEFYIETDKDEDEDEVIGKAPEFG